MTERLRIWLGSQSTEYTATLRDYNINIETLRANNISCARSVTERAAKYKTALENLLEKTTDASGGHGRSHGSQEKTRSTARLLTNSMIALADTQESVVRQIQQYEESVSTLQKEIDNLRIETLRELTRLRANSRSATWHAPAQPLRVGTYLESATEQGPL